MFSIFGKEILHTRYSFVVAVCFFWLCHGHVYLSLLFLSNDNRYILLYIYIYIKLRYIIKHLNNPRIMLQRRCRTNALEGRLRRIPILTILRLELALSETKTNTKCLLVDAQPEDVQCTDKFSLMATKKSRSMKLWSLKFTELINLIWYLFSSFGCFSDLSFFITPLVVHVCEYASTSVTCAHTIVHRKNETISQLLSIQNLLWVLMIHCLHTWNSI